MSSDPTPSSSEAPYTPSALPSTAARAVAFGAILVSGFCGGVIGYALMALQYDSPALAGLGALVGALAFAAGVAVVATLALRAMAEWQITQQRDADQPPSDTSTPTPNGTHPTP